MMTIMLYGSLGKKYGKVHRYHVKSPREAVKALSATIPGFKKDFIEGGYYKILRAGKESLSLEDCDSPQSQKETIRIVPVVAGGGDVGKIVLGAALIWVGWSLGGANFAFSNLLAGTATASQIFGAVAMNIGFNLLLGGVSQLLFAPNTPKETGSREAVENKPSFAFSGAINTVAQGNAIPVCYGRLRVGSQVISAGLDTVDIGDKGTTAGAAPAESGPAIWKLVNRK